MDDPQILYLAGLSTLIFDLNYLYCFILFYTVYDYSAIKLTNLKWLQFFNRLFIQERKYHKLKKKIIENEEYNSDSFCWQYYRISYFKIDTLEFRVDQNMSDILKIQLRPQCSLILQGFSDLFYYIYATVIVRNYVI